MFAELYLLRTRTLRAPPCAQSMRIPSTNVCVLIERFCNILLLDDTVHPLLQALLKVNVN